MRKYRNSPTMVGMIRFDSKADAKRYWELKLLAQGKQIHDLKRQIPFALYGVIRRAILALTQLW